MKPNVFVGGMMMINGIYLIGITCFFPEKLSPRVSRRTMILLCVGIILGGALGAFAPLIFGSKKLEKVSSLADHAPGYLKISPGRFGKGNTAGCLNCDGEAVGVVKALELLVPN
jgi:hypothetical protein